MDQFRQAVLRHACIATVVAGVLALLFMSLRYGRTSSKLTAARLSTMITSSTDLPASWTWKDIRVEDSETYNTLYGKPIAVGEYTSPVFDQHMSNWCGCCYLVAVVQMLQDRMHLLLGLRNPEIRVFPCFQYDMQLALDTYNAHERKQRNDKWNACTGGMPTRVINAIRLNKCLLRLSSDSMWMGHPIGIAQTPLDGETNIKLEELESLEMAPESIMRRILKYGPVVLGINSLCLRDPSISKRGGLIDVKIVAPRDHAVTVVGWKKVARKLCWIMRNSWGVEFVPTERPDPSCVGDNFNRCVVNRTDWIGDPANPGYAYIPVDYEALRGYPSPWYDAIPTPLQKEVPRGTSERHDLLGNASAHGNHYTSVTVGEERR